MYLFEPLRDNASTRTFLSACWPSACQQLVSFYCITLVSMCWMLNSEHSAHIRIFSNCKCIWIPWLFRAAVLAHMSRLLLFAIIKKITIKVFHTGVFTDNSDWNFTFDTQNVTALALVIRTPYDTSTSALMSQHTSQLILQSESSQWQV